ncbi:hypothetical protein LTR22_022997 [Elasticomyces elasticus]|nr:hypothetical protein LTR22_022997 [Elasticomyces elasticus]KAK4918751.1 hypothetical protein LTR49_013538 [Elasticomyces elasticus]
MATTERGSIGVADISTPEDMPTSHFLSLPPELRNRIYEYVMTVGTVYVKLQRNGKKLRGFVITTDGEDLSANEERCRVIRNVFDSEEDDVVYQESAQLFYVCNRFEVQVHFPGTKWESGVILRGLFAIGAEPDPRLFASGLQELVDTIGSTNANLLTDVVFSMGQVDNLDLDQNLDEIMVTFQKSCDFLRPFDVAWPSWRFKLGMSLLHARADWEEKEAAYIMQEVCLDMGDFRQATVSAMARLNDRASSEHCVHTETSVFSNFLGELQNMA